VDELRAALILALKSMLHADSDALSDSENGDWMRFCSARVPVVDGARSVVSV
jgi:hypothetical protein